MAPSVARLVPDGTLFFVCDIQTKFRPAIHGFDDVVATASKMLKIAKHFEIPVVTTVQNAKALGPTVPELDIDSLGSLHLGTIDKTLFSMLTPEVKTILKEHNIESVVLFGIESHVCVLQSTLDLLAEGFEVHVLADGVSSCNKEEVPWALARMRQAGAQVTTSESASFQLQRDSSQSNFKPFATIIKDEKETTKRVLESLCPARPNL